MLKRRRSKGKKAGNVGKAFVKTFIILSYYILVGIVGQMTFTYYEANRDKLVGRILCSSVANQEFKCDANVDTTLKVLSIGAIIMIAFMPVVALIFSFNPKTCTNLFRS